MCIETNRHAMPPSWFLPVYMTQPYLQLHMQKFANSTKRVKAKTVYMYNSIKGLSLRYTNRTTNQMEEHPGICICQKDRFCGCGLLDTTIMDLMAVPRTSTAMLNGTKVFVVDGNLQGRFYELTRKDIIIIVVVLVGAGLLVVLFICYHTWSESRKERKNNRMGHK